MPTKNEVLMHLLEQLTTQASVPKHNAKLLKGLQQNFEFKELQKSCLTPCHVSLKTGGYRKFLGCRKPMNP